MSAIIMVGLKLIVGPTVSVDILLVRMYWLPITPLNELPKIFAPIVKWFPVFPLLPCILLLAAGLLSLVEMD
jgi:hypothetical protein